MGTDDLFGGNGRDTLAGGDGRDYLDGGRGEDTASYAGSTDGVVIDLEAGTASGGHAENDTLVDIENIEGSTHDDIITGDGEINVLTGLGGQDTLSGGGGFDALIGGSENDTLYGGADGDWLFGGMGADILVGGAGGDLLFGGAHMDTLSYEGSDAGVTIDLEQETASGGHAQDDVFGEIENVTGSDHVDVLTGDENNNILAGKAGADILSGGAGGDKIGGGEGDDWIDGGLGSDQLTGGADDDTFHFGALSGNDWIMDFETGADAFDVIELDVTGFDTFDDVIAASIQSGADTVIQLNAKNSITLVDVGLAELSKDDFSFV